MIRRPPRSTLDRSSAASDVYKRQVLGVSKDGGELVLLDHPEPDARVLLDLLLEVLGEGLVACLLYTSPSPRDRTRSRMPSSA